MAFATAEVNPVGSEAFTDSSEWFNLTQEYTPTVDPVNMTIVTLPLILLYFVSVGLAYLLYRPRTPRDFSD